MDRTKYLKDNNIDVMTISPEVLGSVKNAMEEYAQAYAQSLLEEKVNLKNWVKDVKVRKNYFRQKLEKARLENFSLRETVWYYHLQSCGGDVMRDGGEDIYCPTCNIRFGKDDLSILVAPQVRQLLQIRLFIADKCGVRFKYSYREIDGQVEITMCRKSDGKRVVFTGEHDYEINKLTFYIGGYKIGGNDPTMFWEAIAANIM